jgi:hypothetical protein
MFQRKDSGPMNSSSAASSSSSASKSSVDMDAGPLDNDEQETVIEDLRAQAQVQSRVFKRLLSILFSCLGFGFAGVLVYTHHYPWELSHQAVFQDLVSIICFKILYGLMSIVCFLLAVVIKVLRCLIC